jgi:hypothetical protein
MRQQRNKILALATLLASLAPSGAHAQEATTKSSRQARPGVPAFENAMKAFREGDWAKAVAAYQLIVAANPHEGQHWYNLGFALHSLKRHDEAIKAWEKASELGFQPAAAVYNIACAHAMMGHKDQGIDWLQKALAAGFDQDELLATDTDLDSLRDDARFKKLVGAAPEGLSREERWSHDLDYLASRMEKVHYSLYAKVSRDTLAKAVSDLKARTSSLDDDEVAIGVQGILAAVGDGHTTLVWQRHGRDIFKRYPVDLYLFKEGLHVRSAAPELADIVGGQVLRIGNASAEDALRAVAPLCSRDNAMGVKLHGPEFLMRPAVLSYLKIAESRDRVTLAVKTPAGEEKQVELKADLIKPAQAKTFVQANAKSTAPEPLAFKKNDEEFWFEYVPEKKMVYFQFNEVANKPDQPFEKFCGELFAFIDTKPVEYLVIDMRNNSGGNNFLNRPLVHGLIKCDKVNRDGHLIVLVGRRTFSAAMNAAVDIERNTRAIFVGEPTGSSPNFVGETTVLTLPCSKLRVSCSSLYWQSSTPRDQRKWIAPCLLAEPSIAALVENRDPVLELILECIESDRADRKETR